VLSKLRAVILAAQAPQQHFHVSNQNPAAVAVANMEGLFFNVNGGYLEGIVRGYRNALLTGQNYNNLTQCETIDGRS
jgi:hypothetical protein